MELLRGDQRRPADTAFTITVVQAGGLLCPTTFWDS